MSKSLIAALLFALPGVASAYSSSEDEMKEKDAIACPAGVTLDYDGKCIAMEDCALTVLHDKETGWVDDCEGLTMMEGNHTAEICKDTCYKDPKCAVWQYSNYKDGVLKEDTFCYTGIPSKDCQTRTSPVNFTTLAGQRVQRGKVSVDGSALGVEVMGLKQFLMSTGTVEEQQERCKLQCYSDLFCGVWQYEIFDGAQSCWIEKDTARTGVENKTNAFSKRVSAGEYITHYCAVATPDETPWPWIIAGIIVGLLALGALLYFLLHKTPKVKKTRAVKIAEKPAPVVPLFIPQPSILIPIQQTVAPAPVIQQYAPVPQQTTYVEYAAPATYAAPTSYAAPVSYSTGSVAVSTPLLAP